MTRQIITPFDENWLDTSTGWMTKALSVLDTVEPNTELVGLYLRSSPDGKHANSYGFVISPTRIVQDLPNDRYAVIYHHEVRIYKRSLNPGVWLETHGRYFDGVDTVWQRESAQMVQHFTIGANLIPTAQRTFIIKVLKQLHLLHVRNDPSKTRVHRLNKVKKVMEIDEGSLAKVLKKPFGSPTEEMVAYLQKLQGFFDPATGRPLSKPHLPELAELVSDFVIIYAQAINAFTLPGKDVSKNTPDQVEATKNWIRGSVSAIYSEVGKKG